ncbi:hypothetical protein BH20CHL6_BH20CHL6_03580 [soil metagenome]
MTGRLQSLFAAYFRGHQADDWPRGVQEEDRQRPWGRSAAGELSPSDEAKPLLRTAATAIKWRRS